MTIMVKALAGTVAFLAWTGMAMAWNEALHSFGDSIIGGSDCRKTRDKAMEVLHANMDTVMMFHGMGYGTITGEEWLPEVALAMYTAEGDTPEEKVEHLEPVIDSLWTMMDTAIPEQWEKIWAVRTEENRNIVWTTDIYGVCLFDRVTSAILEEVESMVDSVNDCYTAAYLVYHGDSYDTGRGKDCPILASPGRVRQVLGNIEARTRALYGEDDTGALSGLD